jgi:pyruvate ferredoxin oxidoreductase alpha subunit
MAVVKQKESTRVPQSHDELISGSEAVAHALRLADVDVIAAYPIRPYDTVMQFVSKLIADGRLDAEFIVAESEHSQFEIVKHACSVGARAFCGSSGVGWMHAMECLAVTPSLRLPYLALCGNRALDDPGAFGTEHNDALTVRDLGWMLYWVETAQEALDMTLIGYRAAEDRRLSLPLALNLDGAFLTHSAQIVSVPPQELVNSYLPRFDLGDRVLHPDNPISIAPQANEDWLMEIRKQTDEAMRRAPGIIRQAHAEFAKVFGRQGDNPFIEEYMTDDAETVLVGMGTLASPIRVLVRKLRSQGEKVGFVRVKWFRPLGTEELRTSLSRFRAVGVVDRDFGMGSPDMGGVLFNDIRALMYDAPRRPVISGFVAGLGGREVEEKDALQMFRLTQKAAEGGRGAVTWIGVRE